MQVFLETDRLVLRQFTMADADNLVNLDADPDVMRFVTGGIPTSREEIEDEVLPAFLGYYQRYEGYGFWAAIEKATGEFLGWFHFRPRDGAAPGEAEFGYRVRKSAWGWPYPIDATSSGGGVRAGQDRMAARHRRRQLSLIDGHLEMRMSGRSLRGAASLCTSRLAGSVVSPAARPAFVSR